MGRVLKRQSKELFIFIILGALDIREPLKNFN